MEATLQEILEARERRAARQAQLLRCYHTTLVCFTMNIAGPVKYSPLIARGFALGCMWLEAQLSASGYAVVFQEKLPRHTGCEAFYAVDAPADKVKELTLAVEEGSGLGRLFDMDVLDAQGRKLQRPTERKCLICSQSARVCGPRRAHSVEQLQEKTQAILCEAVHSHQSRAIGALASKALLYEVCTTPKPGLVDRNNSGSHRDMDIFTFLSSTAALQPYFESCALAGLETAELPAAATFARLRYLGRNAEQTMLKATGGVNTHKGAIFTMGLLCAAAARLEEPSPETVLQECAAMCAGLTAELADITEENAKTTGQRLYAAYGITGIRGQAEQGYPAVLHTGLPVLREGLSLGYSLERSGCAALLAMLTAHTDTNLVARSDRETAKAVSREVALLLAKDRYPGPETLHALDEVFISKNLSIGGTADLLAACYFLHFLEEL